MSLLVTCIASAFIFVSFLLFSFDWILRLLVMSTGFFHRFLAFLQTYSMTLKTLLCKFNHSLMFFGALSLRKSAISAEQVFTNCSLINQLSLCIPSQFTHPDMSTHLLKYLCGLATNWCVVSPCSGLVCLNLFLNRSSVISYLLRSTLFKIS